VIPAPAQRRAAPPARLIARGGAVFVLCAAACFRDLPLDPTATATDPTSAGASASTEAATVDPTSAADGTTTTASTSSETTTTAGTGTDTGTDTDTDTDTDSTTACQPTPWYPDLDDDSYGDPAGEILACEAPPGTIEQGGDCDDQDPDRSPGAGELCDDIDNDCDGYVDEYAATNTSCGGCLMAELGGSVYHRCPALMTWQAARAACQQRYADLLVLEQLDEHDLLLQQLDVPGGVRWWIGLHDLDLEGAHTWVDGAPLVKMTANWDSGQPDNANNEDCVELQVEGQWNDLRCEIKRGFVCEGPPVGR
jgi:hypothetical protein